MLKKKQSKMTIVRISKAWQLPQEICSLNLGRELEMKSKTVTTKHVLCFSKTREQRVGAQIVREKKEHFSEVVPIKLKLNRKGGTYIPIC